MLYQAGDPANEIYFIHSGKVKLIVDLNDHVKDEHLLKHITNYEKRQKELHGDDDEVEEHFFKKNLKIIIQYTEGGYFGDSDIFAHACGLTTETGRDLSALGVQDCSLFVLPKRELQKMKDNFRSVFDEMEKLALKRFKNHKVLIAHQLAQYINYIKYDTNFYNTDKLGGDSNEVFEEEEDSESDISNLHSENSDRVELDYKKAKLALEAHKVVDFDNHSEKGDTEERKQEIYNTSNLGKDQ